MHLFLIFFGRCRTPFPAVEDAAQRREQYMEYYILWWLNRDRFVYACVWWRLKYWMIFLFKIGLDFLKKVVWWRVNDLFECHHAVCWERRATGLFSLGSLPDIELNFVFPKGIASGRSWMETVPLWKECDGIWNSSYSSPRSLDFVLTRALLDLFLSITFRTRSDCRLFSLLSRSNLCIIHESLECPL